MKIQFRSYFAFKVDDLTMSEIQKFCLISLRGVTYEEIFKQATKRNFMGYFTGNTTIYSILYTHDITFFCGFTDNIQ